MGGSGSGRTTKKNKFTNIANNTVRNASFRDNLTHEERIAFDKMSVADQDAYEKYCGQNINCTILQYLSELEKVTTDKEKEPSSSAKKAEAKHKVKTEPISTTEEPIVEPDKTVQKVQDLISSSFVEKEPGKNISVYLSADSLRVLQDYKKKNKIKNRSSIIESLIQNVLK